MSLRKRIERLEGALVPSRNFHVVDISTWSPAQIEAYDKASEEEQWEMLRPHLPEEVGPHDLVVISAVPRPQDVKPESSDARCETAEDGGKES